MKIRIKNHNPELLCHIINKLNSLMSKLNSNNFNYHIDINKNNEYIISIDDKYKSVIYDLFKYTVIFNKESVSIIDDSVSNIYISDDYFRRYDLNNVTENFIEISYFYNYGKNIDNTTDKIADKIIEDLNVIYNRSNNIVLIITDDNLIKLIRHKLKKINNKYYYDVNNRLDKYLL